MRSLTLLLELLTVIPEEFQTLILSSTRRTAVRHTFAAGGALSLNVAKKAHHIMFQLFQD